MHAMHVGASCMGRGSSDASANDVGFILLARIAFLRTFGAAQPCQHPTSMIHASHGMQEVQCMPCIFWASCMGRGSSDANANDVGFLPLALIVILQTVLYAWASHPPDSPKLHALHLG